MNTPPPTCAAARCRPPGARDRRFASGLGPGQARFGGWPGNGRSDATGRANRLLTSCTAQLSRSDIGCPRLGLITRRSRSRQKAHRDGSYGHDTVPAASASLRLPAATGTDRGQSRAPRDRTSPHSHRSRSGLPGILGPTGRARYAPGQDSWEHVSAGQSDTRERPPEP